MSETDILMALLEIPDAGARARYLDEACGSDKPLRQRVEALLHSHESTGRYQSTLTNTQDADSSTTQGRPTEPDVTRADSGRNANDSDEDAFTFLGPSERHDAIGRLGHYEILQLIGRGAFGIVFRAFDDLLQRVVAVKVMAPELAATSPARKRFLREARSSAQIRHENVVQVHAVEEQPLPYLVMEFIPGETLQQRLDRTGPLDIPQVLRIGHQIAEGLSAAQANDLIHRDIKPGNMLLEGGPQMRVKITDFGLARTADDASISQSGLIAGTPLYMSPEQVNGRTLDQRSDLFSLGSVLYQMVTGRPPFRASTTTAVLKRVAEDTPRPIREIIPETPQWLCDIISKLHAKDPDDRFQSAREVADLLADCEAKVKAKQDVKNLFPAVKGSMPSGWKKWVAAAIVVPLLALGFTELTGVTNWLRRQRPATETTKHTKEPGASQVTKKGTPGSDVPAIPVVSFADDNIKRIATLPAAEQIEEVRKELKKRNPNFKGELTPTIDKGSVVELQLNDPALIDVTPIQALRGLQRLRCFNSNVRDLGPLLGLPLRQLQFFDAGKIVDLSPLHGMPLEDLYLWAWTGTDLAPLNGMPLKRLNVGGNYKELDLTPLADLPLEWLILNHTEVSDLSPLKKMSLRELGCNNTLVSDLAPLRGMPLKAVSIKSTKVTDLTPLKGTPLEVAEIDGTLVTDLSPLKDLPLKKITGDFQMSRDSKVLREIKTLETINNKPVAVFWKEMNPP
jgi:serine/threonine protein kinase